MSDELKKVTLQSTYNEELVKECRKLGGTWNAKEKTWEFSDLVEKEVNDLSETYNSNLVSVEIEYLEDASSTRESIKELGYIIAYAFGRDSGAKIGEGVSMISGEVSSGGSAKNWTTKIGKGSVFRMRIPSSFVTKNREIIKISLI